MPCTPPPSQMAINARLQTIKLVTSSQFAHKLFLTVENMELLRDNADYRLNMLLFLLISYEQWTI